MKPAPMTTIFRFFSAKFLVVEEKLRRIPPFALGSVLDSTDRDADIILEHCKDGRRVFVNLGKGYQRSCRLALSTDESRVGPSSLSRM